MHRLLSLGLAMLAGLCATSAPAQQKAPDFSWNNTIGWVGAGGGGPNFVPVPGHLPPVSNDPAHPFVPNGTAKQPTFRIADLSNPNLRPWVKERMKKDNDEVLAGKIAFTARSSCQPAGVPGFMAYGGPNPLYFIQTPKQVWMIYSGDQQVRRVYLDVPHSANPRPSWYGESVGHYEGDTFVIDTIGQNDKTFVDPYRTPHTDKLHTVERWKMLDGGEAMEVSFTVEDADAFFEPWSGMRRYRRVQQELAEEVCAENNQSLFDYHIPVASKADF
ncbi:MAG TPA: hypothetical protein VIY51_12090 [Xanthobacteraceae bacterium]